MTIVFVGNMRSPLARYRFDMVVHATSERAYFYDRGVCTFHNSVYMPSEKYFESYLSLSKKILYKTKINHIISFFALLNFCLKNKVRVIIFHGVSVQLLSFIGLILDVKIVATPQGSDINRRGNGINARLTRVLLNQADVVTYKSNAMMKRIMCISNCKRLANLNWGVDPVFENQKFEGGNTKFTIFSPRQNKPNYNVDVIAKAVKKLKHEGLPLYFINVSLTEEGVASIFADETHYQLSSSEMAKIYLRSDVMVSVPSQDGFSTSVMEGLMLGVLPIISDIPAYSEEFPSDQFMVRKIKDICVEELAAKLRGAYHDWSAINSTKVHRQQYAKISYGRTNQMLKLKSMLANL